MTAQAKDHIENLVSIMTLAEKIGQMTMAAADQAVTGPSGTRPGRHAVRDEGVGSLLNVWGAEKVDALQRCALEETRLRIPLIFGLDVLHGHRTIFPVPLAEAGHFDPALWEAAARAAAAEAAQDGISMIFAPMIDIARDPRWGRIVEGPGEDAFIASRFAEAKIRGLQDGSGGAAPVAAVAKHFCAYGAAAAGRDYASADLSERTLHEVYLPPFAAAVAAGARAIMPAFNDMAGEPMTAHRALLKGWLRERIGFEGVLVSDYNAIAELIAHGVAEDMVHAAALALNAGIDIDMASGAYLAGLPAALERGLVGMDTIDTTVRRILTLKWRLGLFTHPYTQDRAGPAPREPARKLARDIARRAIVLLTHREPVLPLPPDLKSLALIGPLAEAREDMLGPWASDGRAEETVSIAEGLRTALPDCRITCAQGVAIESDGMEGLPAALDLARASDIVVLCLGESRHMSGEAASRAQLALPGRQGDLARAILDLGKPVIVLLTAGRPLAEPWIFDRAAAVLATWFPGSEAGHAIADILTGRFNPSGKLAVTWPRHAGQVPVFFGQRPTGRPGHFGEQFSSTYQDVTHEPQFPFGHGLSYSRFRVGDLQCPPAVPIGEALPVSVSVTNEGPLEGETTLFLFIHDPVASIARPVLELRGFHKIVLRPGETRKVDWLLPPEAFALLDRTLTWVSEPGEIEILVSQSADLSEARRGRTRLLEAGRFD